MPSFAGAIGQPTGGQHGHPGTPQPDSHDLDAEELVSVVRTISRQLSLIRVYPEGQLVYRAAWGNITDSLGYLSATSRGLADMLVQYSEDPWVVPAVHPSTDAADPGGVHPNAGLGRVPTAPELPPQLPGSPGPAIHVTGYPIGADGLPVKAAPPESRQPAAMQVPPPPAIQSAES